MASHPIASWCNEERCRCGAPASHKIYDQTGPVDWHSLTTYVCCDCMRRIGMDCRLYPPMRLGDGGQLVTESAPSWLSEGTREDRDD